MKTKRKTHKKDVREDTAEHAGLDDADLTLRQSNNANNEFHRIAKRRIQQPANGLAQFRRKLLGRKTQERSQRNNCEEVEDEDDARVPIQNSRNDAQRHEDEQHIHIAGEERQPGNMKRLLRVLLPRLGVSVPPERSVSQSTIGFSGNGIIEQSRAFAWAGTVWPAGHTPIRCARADFAEAVGAAVGMELSSERRW